MNPVEERAESAVTKDETKNPDEPSDERLDDSAGGEVTPPEGEASAAADVPEEAAEPLAIEPPDVPAEKAVDEPPKEGRREGRLARLRFTKKKDMPGGLWLKCESCAEVIFRKELEEKGRVCPACGFHFTLPGRERISMILDAGTWKEFYAELTALDRLDFQDALPYAQKLQRTVERTGQNEALLCGTGQILGRDVVLAVLDFGFMGGSMGEVVGEKIALACELARETRRALIIFTSSGGARMHEGVLSLMQMAKTCAALQSLNEAGIISICVMTHPTTGGVTASFASVTDFVLAEPGALIGFAGPRVIATTLKQELPPGFQRSEFLIDKGMLDEIVPRTELPVMLARLIDYAAGPIVVDPLPLESPQAESERDPVASEAEIVPVGRSRPPGAPESAPDTQDDADRADEARRREPGGEDA